MSQPLRILIVDDSALMRRLIRSMVEQDPDLSVVGEAANGHEAIARTTELHPDLITLDVHMPVMDGIETTRQIMAYQPTPILVVTASLSGHNAGITFEMLAAGALDVMEKPPLSDSAAIEQARKELIRKIKLLARVKVVTHLRGRRKPSGELTIVSGELPNKNGAALSPQPSALSPQPSAFPIVVIGASTGGPRVIRQILAGLPANYAAAVLVVQHIAEGFGAGLVEWLALSSALPIALAEAGHVIRPGQVLVAPDRYDLLVGASGRAQLSSHPVLLQRPAIDITMQSVAAICGPLAIGVLLSGMGRDGALGLLSIRRAGGYTIAQDEASCIIFGMPKVAIEIGAALAVLPPDKIITALVDRVASRQTRPA